MKKAGYVILSLLIALGTVSFPQTKAHADSPFAPQLAAGYYHSVSLISSGTVWTWGNNDSGQLGNGATTNRNIPVLASGLTDVKAVAGGVRSSYAIKKDGTVWAWGKNDNGQLGDGSATPTNQNTAVRVVGLTDVTAVSSGVGYHALALKGDGAVWAWGKNDNGELGNGTTASVQSTPVQVSGLSGITAIAAGGYYSLALKGDGTVWAWGYNGNGELGDGTTAQRTTPVQVDGLTGVTAIAAGGSHSLALKGDGTVWGWGQNWYGTLGDGSTSNRTRPVQATGLSGVTAIAGGGFHSLALKNDGTVWSWGSNAQGQLGDGTSTQRTTPVPIPSLTDVGAIAAGGFHSVAMRNDGNVWSWGYNGHGELGDRTWTSRYEPVQSAAVLDTTAPTPGGAGVITVSSVTYDRVSLTWTKASDNMTAQSGLQYLVYRSGSGNIGMVSTIVKATPVGVFANDLETIEVTGLSPDTDYFFNVLVKDRANVAAVYTMKKVRTNALTFTVTYNGNGSDDGAVPVDGHAYEQADMVTVAGNTGGLSRLGYTFAGWTRAADGSGTVYAAGSTFPMGNAGVTLYAKWTADPTPTFTVTYNGNGSDDGAVPVDGHAYEQADMITVAGNTGGLSRLGYTFAGWTRAADGSGTVYAAGSTFPMGNAGVTLYAKWTADPTPTFTVTYDGNGSDDGAVPVDGHAYEQGNPVTVAGNTGGLIRLGYTFAGWTRAADGSGTVYAAGSTFPMGNAGVTLYAKWTADPGPDPGVPGSDATLTGLSLSAGAYPIAISPAFSRFTPAYAASVGYGIPSVSVTASVYDSHASVTVSVYDRSNTRVLGPIDLTSGQPSAELPLQVGKSRIEWTVTAEDGTTGAYTLAVMRAYPAEPEEPSAKPEPPKLEQPDTGLKLMLDGRPLERIASSVVRKVDGQTVMIVQVDGSRLAEQLDKAGEKPEVVIQVTQIAEQMTTELTGYAVKALENKRAVLEIESPIGTYRLPAAEIVIEELAKRLGQQIPLEDIIVHVRMAQGDARQFFSSNGAGGGGVLTVVAPPVEFAITASYKGQTVEASTFGSYVEREIALPDGINPDGITTAVVVEADGTVRHVPTRIITRNGKVYAVVNSLTNSVYAVVRYPMAFTDMEGHWAKSAVNDMASRMIVGGVGGGSFDPDAAITRAQFAAIVVRALGLADSAKADAFTDVKPGDWFSGAVAKAKEYGIIDGYEDGTFRPSAAIRREEAMIMLARAMRLTGLEVGFSGTEVQRVLAAFADKDAIDEWARTSAAAVVRTGLAEGEEAGLLPQRQITRAETAVIVRRLLEKLGLIG